MGTKSGIRPFDVAALTKANFMDPKNVGYQDSIDIIYDELHKTRKSFIKIGWYLKHIREAEMYKEDGYVNIYEFAHDKFNISQSTANRFIDLCNEFSVGHDSPELDEKYLDFSVSQLFEMLPMQQEQKEQITPDMTIKEIRGIKKETKSEVKEPSDDEICLVYEREHLQDIDRKDLKEYLSVNYKHRGSGPNPDIECTPRGIRINSSDEITWTRFVNRVNELIPMDDNIPGQTSIANDFPEYMPDNDAAETTKDVQDADEESKDMQLFANKTPSRCMTGWSKYPEYCSCCGYKGVQCCVQCERGQNHDCNSRCGWVDDPYKSDEVANSDITNIEDEKYATSHKSSDDELTIIDGEYKEIDTLYNAEEKECAPDEKKRNLRNEIESLADDVRRIFWEWSASKKMPREEIIMALKNSLKLTDAIEKLLNMIS